MIPRRLFLKRSVASTAAPACMMLSPNPVFAGADATERNPVAAAPTSRAAPELQKALIALSLDLEMSRNFPTWDQTHWDYEKGNLDEATKTYAVEAARRVKEKGGRIHFFAVGRVFEQESVAWLEEIVKAGHPVGNHTYDHVNVKATRPEDVQFRFQRAPWLIEGKKPAEVIAENIRTTSLALKARLGIDPAGFRTPGGFSNGLEDRPDVQAMLLGLGYRWVSSKYPAHPVGSAGEDPPESVLREITKSQEIAQPFRYPSGLVEVPMSPPSDITAFRGGRWKLDAFLRAVRMGVEWAIEHRAVFDFLGHPSCLVAVDPEFKTIEMICDLVRAAAGKAELTDLGAIARQVR